MFVLAQRISDGVRGFLNQRDDLVLVLEAADSDVPAGLKIIEAVDAELAHVWGWIFAQSFADPASYVDALIQDIGHKRTAISASLQREGKPPLPPETALMRDRNCDPVDRLRAAVLHVRAMAPRLSGGVTLFGLMPLKIGDGAAYGALMRGLVRHELPFPWCAGVRFIIREDAARPALTALASGERARVLRVDFGPEALAAAAAREAADEGLPRDQRAAAATVAAGIHQSHGRTTEAEAHYEAALQHYGETGNAPMAAVAANGIAACRQAQGDVVGAERIMLAALEASLQASPPALPATLNILLDLTMLVARQGRWGEVEAYATATRDVAGALVRPGVEAEALNRRAFAQSRLAKIDEAEQSWREAIGVADAAEEAAQALTARTHLLRLLERSGRAADARELTREIADLRRAQSSSATPASERGV